LAPDPSQKAQLRLDLKLLSKLIYELNIARHHTITYPAGHPVIGQSVRQALSYLGQLQPENGLLSLGISKDKLVIGQTILDEKNPVFREFASHFFDHGIAAATFSRDHRPKQGGGSGSRRAAATNQSSRYRWNPGQTHRLQRLRHI
jgi:hypothetical protein